MQEFAQLILDFINNPKEERLGDREVYSSATMLTDSLCDVCIDGIVMTKSEKDKENIVNDYHRNNKIREIDWQKRKKL
ncbi:hypothetical protein IPG41_03335 [Candidatus Peregrinibacteria bacterium]|nr:MAG: hypothetical protein IPG41_03335 [Candidatus Peregrinibacteria bacterium]